MDVSAAQAHVPQDDVSDAARSCQQMPESKSSCAKFVHVDNHFDAGSFAPGRSCTDIGGGECQELIVWGGCVANCGEDSLSRIIRHNVMSLRSVTYSPDRTKGGCLIRPGYCRGDRAEKMQFPALTDLTIRLVPPLLPYDYGWITPQLHRFRLLCVVTARHRNRDMYGNGIQDCNLPNFNGLQRWLRVDVPGGMPNRLLDACPQLESITIALCSTKDEKCVQTDWLKLFPPRPMSWSIQRLLLLPLAKPVRDAASGNINISLLSNMSVNIMKIIFGFLGTSRWRHEDHEIPAAVLEELGLPTELLTVRCKDILESEDRTQDAWNSLGVHMATEPPNADDESF